MLLRIVGISLALESLRLRGVESMRGFTLGGAKCSGVWGGGGTCSLAAVAAGARGGGVKCVPSMLRCGECGCVEVGEWGCGLKTAIGRILCHRSGGWKSERRRIANAAVLLCRALALCSSTYGQLKA